MSWCLECHRDPDVHLRDPKLVTDLGWGANMTPAQRSQIESQFAIKLGEETALNDDQRRVIGQFWKNHNTLNPSQDCSTCHR
jgi:hypothetical protein